MSEPNIDPVLGFLRHLVGLLVDHPESVRVEVAENASSISYEIAVAAEDIGKVIGRQGRVANALRNVAKAAAADSSKRVFVDIAT